MQDYLGSVPTGSIDSELFKASAPTNLLSIILVERWFSRMQDKLKAPYNRFSSVDAGQLFC